MLRVSVEENEALIDEKPEDEKFIFIFLSNAELCKYFIHMD